MDEVHYRDAKTITLLKRNMERAFVSPPIWILTVTLG